MTTGRVSLPVAVPIEPQEDIAAYLDRVAAANHVTMPALTGHRRQARVWEDPPTGLLTRMSITTGVPLPRLQAAVLRRAYPGAVPERARTGRRYAGAPATCPAGCVDTVAARLNVVVLCPRCGQLLVDPGDPHPPPPPTKVRQVHREVMATLAGAACGPRARDRLRRLESLMAELEPAVWPNWPPLAEGESPQWRARIVRWEKWNLDRPAGFVRPPSVTATLLALTWDASESPASSTRMLEDIAIMADPWDPPETDLPHWDTRNDARDGLMDHLRELRLQPCHVPTILRLVDEPIVLPEHQRTCRIAEALALTVMAARAHGHDLTLTAAGTLHGASVSARARRVVHVILQSTYGMRRLAVHATLLQAHGLRDLSRARAELRHVHTLPAPALRSLLADTDQDWDPQLGAAWVWLDATRGRLAGGPHPHLAADAMVEFDARLDPETKLHLRQWWQHRLDSADSPLAVSPTVGAASRTGTRDAG